MSKIVHVDRVKWAALSAFSALFLVCSLSLFLVGNLVASVFCLFLAFVYAAAAALNGARICINADGISRRILWFPSKFFRWSQLQEVGVFGTKLFNQRNPNKTGTLYLYFATQAMTDDQRFQMVLRWPPRQIYLAFHPDDLELIRLFWNGDIIGYNVGNLAL